MWQLSFVNDNILKIALSQIEMTRQILVIGVSLYQLVPLEAYGFYQYFRQGID